MQQSSNSGNSSTVRRQWQGVSGEKEQQGRAGRRRQARLTHRGHQLHVRVGVAEAEPAALHRLARLGGGLGARGGGINEELPPHQLCIYMPTKQKREQAAGFESSSLPSPHHSTHTTPRHSRVPVSWQARSISSTLSNWTWQKELSLPAGGNWTIKRRVKLAKAQRRCQRCEGAHGRSSWG